MAAFMSPALMRQVLGAAERFADLEGRTPGECELLVHVVDPPLSRRSVGRRHGGAARARPARPRSWWRRSARTRRGCGSCWGRCCKTDRLDLARRTVETAFAEAHRRGSAPGFATASAWRAWIALREGSGADAEADARAAYERAAGRDVVSTAWCSACLAEVLIERGELGRGAGGPRRRRGRGRRWRLELLLSTRSMLRSAQGRPQAALADQLAARVDAQVPDPDFDGWLRIARLLHATGDAAGRRARGRCRAGLGARLGHAGPCRPGAHRPRAHHRRRRRAWRPCARRSRISSARRRASSSPDRWSSSGAALRRTGERAAAREPLRRGARTRHRLAGWSRPPSERARSCA